MVVRVVNAKTDAEIGQTIYLKPTTKTAPRECYSGAAVRLVSVADWPFVSVWLPDEKREIKIHRLNAVLHPPGFTLKKEGDGANAGTPAVTAKPAFPPHKPLSSGDYEEPMLF